MTATQASIYAARARTMARALAPLVVAVPPSEESPAWTILQAADGARRQLTLAAERLDYLAAALETLEAARPRVERHLDLTEKDSGV